MASFKNCPVCNGEMGVNNFFCCLKCWKQNEENKGVNDEKENV